MNVSTWNRHKCGARHKTARTFLRCALGHEPEISGAGQFAVIATFKRPYRYDDRDRVRTDYHVELFESYTEADAAATHWWADRSAFWDGGPPGRVQLVRVSLATATAWDT